MSAPSPLALDENLAIMAGAGVGKTYSLITICLHLLSGARRARDAQALRPDELCLLTFTDKAAAEMRSRLRERLDALATGDARPTDEADLRASFAALGRPFPGPELWRRVRDGLGSAWIGTFHSLCVQLLRRAPAGFGVDPGFHLLDEREATLLLRDTAERVVLEALEREEPEVVELCRELGFATRGRAPGVVGALCEVLVKLREEGLEAAGVAITRLEEARRAFDEALDRVKGACDEASALDARLPKFHGVLASCRRALDGMRFETFLHPDRFPALRAALEKDHRLTRQQNGLGDALKELKWSALGHEKTHVGLLEHHAACEVVRHEGAFRRLLSELSERHRAELRKRSALDFSELLILSRDLLRDHPTVRREVQDRMGALLVDEFQDTNRLQLELVTLLAERREAGPRRVPPGGLQDLPLEQAFLCAVGDRKQSIYEFRGADVSVFGQLAALVERNGGRRHFLRSNRRSTPALLTFFNRLFRSVLVAKDPAAPARDYEVVYEPAAEDLEPHRQGGRASRVPVDRICYEPEARAPESRAQDAELVARKVRQLLAPKGGLKVEGEDGKPRPLLGKDVAILFRRFTYLEVYRQALARAGVAHRVVRGRGFYAAQEVVDLASLLSLIADPSDAISFAAVLRSPLVALSDASLYRLVQACGGRLQLKSVRAAGPLDRLGLAAAELERLERFLDLHRRLRSERDRLGLRVLLQVALEETGYRVAQAGTPFGEQALANIDKLLELAARRDAAGAGDCAGFATELLALADAEPAEAQADVMDAGDERAVSLMTIHQAKGLEWPVVVVPDLAAGPLPPTRRILFDRTLGLGIKPWMEGELDLGRSPRLQRIGEELSRREEAEYRRLLYVALTRARDHLVLSGQAKGMRSATWRGYLDRALEADPELRALVQDVKEKDIPEPKAPPGLQGSLLLDGVDRVAAAEQRCAAPPTLRPAAVVYPVTHLQSYFLCERRYLYAHVVGLAEFPIHFEAEEAPEPFLPGRTRSPNDPRVRGTLAHALLEKVDLEGIGDEARLDAQLRELLWQLGHEPDTADAREIASWARGFLRSPFAASLKGRRAGIRREVPFLLRLSSPSEMAIHLKGQIDLLVLDESGGATVIDYKASERHPEGLAPYAFQLDCYALAARQLVGEGVPIRTGIAFLKEKDPGPDFRAPVTAEDLRPLEAKLARAAAELVAATPSSDWKGREAGYCASIRCGYQYRCHAR